MGFEIKNVLVLIQSRMSSTRLPGKALLPVCGLPTVVLAAKRASNAGHSVLVLTSLDESDDILCDVLSTYNINFFRGSLSNVLKRFHDALIGYSDETKIFRLTADNVFPDGTLLIEMETAFDAENPDIMSCDPALSNLPYGVSAELTTVGWLRKAFINTNDPYDIEHVTPYVHRNGVSKFFKSNLAGENSLLRVTIDTPDDYQSVCDMFKDIEDPIHEPISNLIGNSKT